MGVARFRAMVYGCGLLLVPNQYGEGGNPQMKANIMYAYALIMMYRL